MKNRVLQQMIRVNQAGEIGADAIYKGQLQALRMTSTIKPTVEGMHSQELKHLAYFNASIGKNRVRPSIMLPLWYGFGYGLGVVV
jgi:3-demethoxyubiquinol 3-hydroxylase